MKTGISIIIHGKKGPSMKKPTKPQKKRYRAEDSTTVTVSIKKELLAQIDQAAKGENRSRSNYIITNMMRAVAKQPRSEQ